MNSSLCTLVVVPRERFSLAEASYESLCAHNPSRFPVIYVDSCHPKPWARRLDALAAEGKITLIRAGFHIGQHEAYNLAIPHIRSKYVIFVDNDILFTPEWAEKLVTCAEETGAAAVMPLYEEKEFHGDWRIHMCGGDCGVEKKDGKLFYTEVYPLMKTPLRDDFTRCQTGFFEYHTFLIRYETLQKVGPFDENLWEPYPHVDFSLMIRASGGTIWFEPSSVVKVQPPPPIHFQDLGFFLTRWGQAKAVSGQQYFSQKWGVEIPRAKAIENWFRHWRRRCLLPIRFAVARRFGSTAGKIAWVLSWPLESIASWIVNIWTHVPDRRQRLEALGSWRAPELDPAQRKAFVEKTLLQPRILGRELSTTSQPVAAAAV